LCFSSTMQSLLRCFDEVSDKCLLENLIGKSSRSDDPGNYEITRVTSADVVDACRTRKRNATVYRLLGCIIMEQSIFKQAKYSGTEFFSIPWILLRFRSFFELDEIDDGTPGYSECADEFAFAPPDDYAEDFAADEYFVNSQLLSVVDELPDTDEIVPVSEEIGCAHIDGEPERSSQITCTDNGVSGSEPPVDSGQGLIVASSDDLSPACVLSDSISGIDDGVSQTEKLIPSDAVPEEADVAIGIPGNSEVPQDQGLVVASSEISSPTSVLSDSIFGIDDGVSQAEKSIPSDAVPEDVEFAISIPVNSDVPQEVSEIAGEVFSPSDEINEPVIVSASVPEPVKTLYKGSPPSVDWFTLVEADVENVAGFDRVISRNDWTTGLKLAPNIPFPTGDDVVLGGIKTTSPGFMQDAINEMLPLHHTIDDRLYQEIVETSDISLELDRCSIDLSHVSSWEKGDGWNSVLETGMTTTRKSTFREVALSVKKRNMNVPALTTICDIEDMSNKVVNNFFDSVVDVNKMVGLPDVILQGEVEWFSEYLKGKAVTEDQFLDPICLVSMDKYRHMIKSQLKPVEDNSLAYERPLAATITYHDKGRVMSTSPVFLAAATRLMLMLSDKVSIPSGKFHQLFSLDAPSFDMVKRWKEIDFSKFDKSQQELHHEIQRKIFLRLGVPQSFVDTWFGSHKVSYISDSTGLKFRTDFQRRTGDACTYLGNTIVTLSVLCYVYDLMDPNVIMVVASGDDSLIGSFEDLDRSNEHLCSTLFNFEAKFPHNQPFICSKFLLTMPTHSGGRKVVAVPNPLKLLIKLGKKNLDPNQFDDWYTSWLDLIHYFDDNHLISVVGQMCAYRYIRKPSQFLEGAMMSFKNLFSSKAKVKKVLFAIQDEGKKKASEPQRRPSKKDRARAAAYAETIKPGSLKIKTK